MPKIRVSSVYKVFGPHPQQVLQRLEQGADRDELTQLGTAAVIDASFDVHAGETFVVMGLSGSGKSTLIRMLNGLWQPTAGSVLLDDVDICDMSAQELRQVRREKISMVFQHFALMPHRTVRENAAYALEIRQTPLAERMERADHWLTQVGLDGWGDKYPHELSGGMQQRVGLARALTADTDILLMDEAFSALDPLIRREMQEQLVDLQSELGKTIVFITHDLNEAMYLGDRIAVMRSGRIVQIGTAEEILTDPANDYVAQFVMDVDRARVLTASSIMQKPVATISADAGPRQALRTMREHEMSGLLVVDRQRRLQGYLIDHEVVEAVKREQPTLEGLIHTDNLITVDESTPLADLFEPSAESLVPLTVTDANQRLVGVVTRVMLLVAMGNHGTAGEEN